MEVLIGFAFGYWVGTKQGRDGIARALEAAREITSSPEARHLLEEGVEAVQTLAPGATSALLNGAGDVPTAGIRDVIDGFVERRFGRLRAAA